METIIRGRETRQIDINISLLRKKEQNELLLFYNYLLFKTEQFPVKTYQKSERKNKKLPKTFYSPIPVETYHKFDRNEIYADR